MLHVLSQQLSIPEHADSRQSLAGIRRCLEIPGTLGAALLTPLVLLVHGYHPLADDGAIYVAGVKKLLYPNLYRPDAVFVTSHLRLSVFAHLLASLVRYTHISLLTVLLVCHLASIFLFLASVSNVAKQIFFSPASAWGALILSACCFTLPVAGTSLFLMDPYVTARSFSTPLCLLALAATLDRAWRWAALWLILSMLLHPLMTAFAVIYLIALVLAERRMWRTLAMFAGASLLLCALVFLFTRHVPLDSSSSRAALSRSYFFLSTWNWYEYPGLFFPLLLFAAAAWRTHGRGRVGALSVASTVIGSCALLAALCFVHRSGSLLLARLQVLRAFHMIYLVGTLLIGGLLGRLMRHKIWIVAGAYAAVLIAMFASQRLTYPASDPIEWPGMAPRNPWQKAFLWIRANTPQNAVFAMDADYIESAGEDAHGFRAIAERSSIADWYKDGGVASIFPAAQDIWWRQVQQSLKLNQASDTERNARLLPLGATWVLLPAEIETGFTCPYINSAVKVCRLGVR